MHIRKHGTGWRVIVQHNGLRRSAVTRTQAEARRKGAEFEVLLGNTIPPSEVTVFEMLTSWLAITEGNHKPTYRVDVIRVIDRAPANFLVRRVSDVQPLLVEMLYRELAATGWTVHRIGRLHQVMVNAWKLVAIPYGYTATNPVAAVKPPKKPATNVRAPTGGDVRTLLAAATGQVALFLELAARTGARRGELCALQWPDLNGHQLNIRRSIATVPGQPLIIGDTKTGSKGQRVIALDNQTVTALEAHHGAQTALYAASGLRGRPLWIFSHDSGVNPWRTDYISREFARLCKTAGIEDVHLHQLRHFVATQLLAAGETPTTVAHRLGHSSTATTLRTYADWVQATDQRAATTMDDVLGEH